MSRCNQRRGKIRDEGYTRVWIDDGRLTLSRRLDQTFLRPNTTVDLSVETLHTVQVCPAQDERTARSAKKITFETGVITTG